MSTISKAFQTSHVEEEPNGVFQTLGKTIDDVFVSSLPDSLREYPKKPMYIMGFLINAALFFIFVALFLIGYTQNVNGVFLSPTDTAGNCKSGFQVF